MSEREVFIARNQQSLAELVMFVDFVDKKLTIGFVEVNFAKDRECLIEIITTHPQCQDIQFEVLNLSDPNLRFVRDVIVEELNKIPRDETKKLVLIIIGLEKSIGMSGDYPPVLQDLNFVRDAFTASVPHPLLFVLPDYAITRLAKYAPDFWAWGRKVFHFETEQLTRDEAIQQTIGSDRMLGSLELSEKQERIDLLQRLLMEYSPSGYSDTGANLKTRINILIQLGQAYSSQGEVAKAREHLEQALELANDHDNLATLKANSWHELGIIKLNQGRFQDAIALFQKSLEIQRRLGDVQAEAVTLNGLANIYIQQGKIEKAIALFKQSLELQRRVGNVQGEAATLNNLAAIDVQQGKIKRAIALFQQSLEIQRRLGDVQGEAATLSNLAGTYVYTEEIEEAIALFQRSLELQQRIGNVKGEAAILHQLAYIHAHQGDIDTAITLYQKSLNLTQRIGDVQGEAATLNNLAFIYAQQEEVEEAITLLQQSLDLTQRIGDVQNQATTLAMLGQLLADKKGEIETALNYLQQALDILQRLQSPDAETVSRILDRVRRDSYPVVGKNNKRE
ncbi:MAG: tetratricopeptide repeat protein [Coleofasciculus sp. A1-SPW-01]|uniref:tetratricopeptide repeat protein n=1 Tax=Coleofasciculus sp. A1-SPW-01 TaxID=3070819 RepID=UPI0032F185C6